MRIVILGAGIIGVMTAYKLHCAGAQVTIIDRRPGAGSECSFANGGQLSYAHCEPWPSPSLPRRLPLWSMTPNGAFRFHKAERDFFPWGKKFLRACSADTYVGGRDALGRLGALSRQMLHEAADDTGIAFARRSAGIMHIARTQHDYSSLLSQARHKQHLDIPYTEIHGCELNDHYALPNMYGGLFYPQDETGDVRECCAGMIAYLQERGVRCLFTLPVKGLCKEHGKITGIRTDNNVIEANADAYVICSGAESGRIAADIGLNLPVYPVKGYSITYAIPPGERDMLPLCGITDQRHKIVYSRLHHLLRAAGMADIDGFDTGIRRKRINSLRTHCERLFPFCIGATPIHEWACLRPFLPDGLPAIGRSSIDNCYVNTGHGSLGWTMAAGSAALLEDCILQRHHDSLSSMKAAFSPTRFITT